WTATVPLRHKNRLVDRAHRGFRYPSIPVWRSCLFWCWRCHITIGSPILERCKQITYLGRIVLTFSSPGGGGCAAFLTARITRTTLVHIALDTGCTALQGLGYPMGL